MPLPGKLDSSLGEFWVENPWHIVARGHNLSCFERNRVYLNVEGRDFVEVSPLSGADSDGDGRAVVAADFRNSGMMDLIVRQAGGGALLYYENRMPPKPYLTVSLRGSKSNRQGVGSRVVAKLAGRQVVREMFPANTYLSQAPNHVHFGLGDQEVIETLVIRWPSGKVQELKGVRGGRHVVIDEGKDGDAAIETVAPGRGVGP